MSANSTVRVEPGLVDPERFVVIFRDARGRDWSCSMRDYESREAAEGAALTERRRLRASGVEVTS